MVMHLQRLMVPILIAALGCSAGTGPRPVPASIKIIQANPFVLDVVDTERLSANVFDSTGVLINAEVRIAWTSTDTSIVHVDRVGTLTPRQVGFCTVRATADANGARVQDSIVVDVTRGSATSRSPSNTKR